MQLKASEITESDFASYGTCNFDTTVGFSIQTFLNTQKLLQQYSC